MATEIPGWAADYIKAWKERLYLGEWETRTSLSPSPNDGIDNMASVALHPTINVAEIELRDDIPDEATPEWKRSIIHELLHVRMARITEYVMQEMIPDAYGASARTLAENSFVFQVEPTIELLTQTLYDLSVSGGNNGDNGSN